MILQQPQLEREIEMPERWGWAFTAECMRDFSLCAISQCVNNPDFHYLEIGLGSVGTIAAVNLIAKQLTKTRRLIGVDLKHDPTHARTIGPQLCKEDWLGDYSPDETRNGIMFLGVKDSLFMGPQLAGMHFCLAFIDGCHCYEHVSSDIKTVVPLMDPRSILIMHDSGPSEQNLPDKNLQSYDNFARLEVRRAILEFDWSGWSLLADDHHGLGYYIMQKQ